MVALVVALGAATPNAHDPDLAARLGLDRTDQVCHDRLVAALDGDRDLPDGRTRAPLPDATPPASVDRSDLTGTFTFTIDGPTSADLDDAISARWNGDDSPVTVQVHIADVAAAVPAGSRLDRRARLLATSTYLAGLSMPMLPADLSEDRCSLLPGQERDTLTVTFDVHADGTVGDTDVFASTVRSDVRLDYRQVAEHMAGSARLPAATAGPVDAAAEAARRLQEDRDDRPTLSHLFDHDRPEAHVDGGAVRLVTPSDDAAHALIEALMVAANEQVASWLHDRDVACLFRVHDGVDPDRAELLDAVADTAGVTLDGYTPEALTDAFEQVDGPWADGMVSAALSAMSRAEYATGLRDHSGLGSARYCHFTSPIRRYADLVVHRQVRAVLAGDTPAPAAQLDDVAAWVNVRAGASSRAEAVEQMLLWASTFDVAGGPVSTVAQVCKVVPAGVQVRLDGSGLPAFLPASVFGRRKLATARGGHATADFSVHVGQRRPVQVVDVDPLGELEVTAA